jgi:hypothetical protein
MLNDRIENGGYILGGILPIGAHPALLGRTVDCREIELFLSSVEVEHQVEHHLLHLIGAAIGLIDLVDHHHRLQTDLDGLLKHETGLRHRTFKSVYEQKTAVGHVQHTFHLTAEIGVSGGVYNIDLVSFIVDRNVFRKDCYTTFAFQIIVVENKFTGILVFAEKVAGKEHLIDQCGFTMVHVGDDGNVTDVLHTNKFSCNLIFSLQSYTEIAEKRSFVQKNNGKLNQTTQSSPISFNR